MEFLAKILNFRSTVRYHKLKVSYDFWKEIIFLYCIKIFRRKAISIIVLPEHIGDIIAFTPFAKKLKIEESNSYIVWVVKPNYAIVLNNSESVNYCISTYCDGVAEKFSNSSFFKVYDVRFNGNNFCSICNTERKYQKIDEKFTLDNYYEYGSLLEIFSKIAGKPLKKEDWNPEINIPESTKKTIKEKNLPSSYICIHTTSTDQKREWTYEKWNELVSRIFKNSNIKIVQIGLENKLNIHNDNFIDLSGQLSLIETAEVIKNAKLYIGIDSGPAHIANAVKVKSIILLGKYREIKNYMPFSGNFASEIDSKIIYNPTIKCSEIEVDELEKEIKLLLKNN